MDQGASPEGLQIIYTTHIALQLFVNCVWEALQLCLCTSPNIMPINFV